MAIVKFPETNLSLKTHGVIGRPWGAGAHLAGWSMLGDDFEYSGVYQRRPRVTGQILVKMRHYMSPNPRTEAQQAWRGYFAIVKQIWDGLTEQERTEWRSPQYPYNMGGWNRYASRFMKAKPAYAGAYLVGMSQLGELTI